MTQQILRIFLNCSCDLTWEHRVKHANEMMKKLQYSGYNKKFRYEVVDSAIKAYRKIVEDDCNGVKPMYRPKGYQTEERKEAKKRKKKEWYTKGGYESVIFIPATPTSILKKSYEEIIKETPLKIKVVEQSGVQLKRMLQTSNPFKKGKCEDAECIVGKSDEKKNCRRNEVKYHIECKNENCDSVYHGETSKNAYTRGKEHREDYHNRLEGSHMWKHCIQKHNREEQQFTMHIDRTFRRDPLLRQITEAIEINDTDEEKRMNSRAEWHQPRVPRINIEI